jgi:hypothetical protein
LTDDTAATDGHLSIFFVAGRRRKPAETNALRHAAKVVVWQLLTQGCGGIRKGPADALPKGGRHLTNGFLQQDEHHD